MLIRSSKLWPSKKYFKEKSEELVNRHHKFGDTANHLEPNVKENPGSLRDLHTLQWLTHRHFHTRCFEELVPGNFLTDREALALRETYTTLARIRFALHLHTGRGEDRLLFDYQHDVATLLGFTEADRNQRVEAFMQCFYRASNQALDPGGGHYQTPAVEHLSFAVAAQGKACQRTFPDSRQSAGGKAFRDIRTEPPPPSWSCSGCCRNTTS